MNTFHLSSEKINEIRRAHRLTKDKQAADRIKSVYLLARGMSASEIARNNSTKFFISIFKIDPFLLAKRSYKSSRD